MDQNTQMLVTWLSTASTVLSLFVAIFAFLAARKANQISQRSLEAQKAENKPIFRVISKIETYAPSQSSESILVQNEGAPIKIDSTNYRIANFLDISVFGAKNIKLPIASKFSGDETYRNQKGDLIKFCFPGVPTYTKALELINEIRRINENIQCFPITYICLPYKNIYEEMYYMTVRYSWHGIVEITLEEFEKMYRQYEDYIDHMHPKNFMDISGKDIIDYVLLA